MEFAVEYNETVKWGAFRVEREKFRETIIECGLWTLIVSKRLNS